MKCSFDRKFTIFWKLLKLLQYSKFFSKSLIGFFLPHKSSLPKGSKAANKKVDVFTAKLNKKLADAEKALKDKDDDEPTEPYDLSDFDPREDIDEQGVLSRRAGINVFGDRKLELISKSLINTARDLHHTAKKKDERNFDEVLDRITISLGVIRSFLNKPKRRM